MARPFMSLPPVLPPTLSQPDVDGLASYVQSSDDFMIVESPENDEQANFTPLEKIYKKKTKKIKRNGLSQNHQQIHNDKIGSNGFQEETILDYQAMPTWPQGWENQDEAALSLYRDGNGDKALPPVNFEDVLGSIFGQPHYHPKPPKPPNKRKKQLQAAASIIDEKHNLEKQKSLSDKIEKKTVRLLRSLNDCSGCFPEEHARIDIRDMCCSLSRAEAVSVGLVGQNEEDPDLTVSAYHLTLVLRVIQATGGADDSNIDKTLMILDEVIQDHTNNSLTSPSIISIMSSSRTKISNINQQPHLISNNNNSIASSAMSAPKTDYVLVLPFIMTGELCFVPAHRTKVFPKSIERNPSLSRKQNSSLMVDLNIEKMNNLSLSENENNENDENIENVEMNHFKITDNMLGLHDGRCEGDDSLNQSKHKTTTTTVSSMSSSSSTATSLPQRLRNETIKQRRDISQSTLTRQAKKQICYTFRRKLNAVSWLKNWLLRAKAKEALGKLGEKSLSLMDLHKKVRRWLRGQYLNAGETKQAAQLIAAATRQRTLRAAFDYHHLAALQRAHRLEVGSSSSLTEAFDRKHRAMLIAPHRHACFLWKLLTLRCKALKVMKIRKKANKFLIKLQRKKFLQVRARAFKLLDRFSKHMVYPLQCQRRQAVERLGIEIRTSALEYSRKVRYEVRNELTTLGRKVVSTRNARFIAYNWLNKIGNYASSPKWNNALKWLCGHGNDIIIKNKNKILEESLSSTPLLLESYYKNPIYNKKHLKTEIYDIENEQFISYDEESIKYQLVTNGYIGYGSGKLEEYLSILICYSKIGYDKWYEYGKLGKLGLGGMLRLHILHQRKDQYILQLDITKQRKALDLREGAIVYLTSLSHFALKRWGASGPFGCAPNTFPYGLPSLNVSSSASSASSSTIKPRISRQQSLKSSSNSQFGSSFPTIQEMTEEAFVQNPTQTLGSPHSKMNNGRLTLNSGVGEGAGGEAGMARAFLRKSIATAGEHARAQNVVKTELASACEFAQVERQIHRLELDPSTLPYLKTIEKQLVDEDLARYSLRKRSVEEATALEIAAAFEVLDLDGSGEIDLVEFSFMMRSLASNNMDLLMELGFPVKTGSSSASSSSRNSSHRNGGGGGRYDGGNDAYVWRMRSFQAMDRDNSGGVSCDELSSWLIHELKIGRGEDGEDFSSNLHLQELNNNLHHQKGHGNSRPSSPLSNDIKGKSSSSPSSSPASSFSRRRSSIEPIIFTPMIKVNDLVTLRNRSGRIFLQKYHKNPAFGSDSDSGSGEWVKRPQTPKTPKTPKSPNRRPKSPESSTSPSGRSSRS